MPVFRQAQHFPEEGVGHLALVFDVVDGEQGFDALVFRNVVVEALQESGHQGGLPVVAVDHIGIEIDVGNGFQNGSGEVGKPFAVIVIPVDVVPVEVIFVVYKVIIEVGLGSGGFEDTTVQHPPAQRHAEAGDEFNVILGIEFDFFVVGKNDGHFHIRVVGKFIGQGIGHVSQAAGFDIGGRFAGGKQYFHIAVLSYGYKDLPFRAGRDE